MSEVTSGSFATADELSSLVSEFAQATTVAQAADLLVKYALHQTGARWAEVVEPRGPRTAAILASTDIELSRLLLGSQQLASGVMPLPEQHPISETLVLDDLRTDPRWPTFAAYATELLPVRSAVLQYIAVEGRYAAGLAVYDDQPGFFTAEHVRATRLLATIAGLALAGLSDARRAGQLDSALVSNRTIGTAVGILMSTDSVSRIAAFERLVTASQHTNRKLRDVAGEVVASGRLPAA